ncbi:MAG: hypothetical protein EU539_00095 [Promethearchaeota archaeon]|nr:MAG: hypothetical protein EU539_00095 [Candidatus Lokiarchaeota archaeon]
MNEKKFLTDAMFGKLTRFLRIFGYDTVYADDLKETFNVNPVPDELLAEYALENDRIIITRDYPFYKKNRDRSIFLKGEGVYNYLHQLKNTLNLEYNFDMPKARCSICNSELRKVKDKIEIKNEVKHETYKHYEDFYRCVNCKKIFWRGTHIEKIIKQIKKREA